MEVQALEEARTHGITTPFEKEYIRKDNSRVPILIGGALLEESSGLEQTIVFSLDLSDRKRTQEALRQREEQLRLITNAVPVFISYVDAEQRYRFNNKKYEELYGVSASEIYGKQIQELVDESVYESIRPYIEAVLSGEEVTYETKIPEKDGASRYVEVSYVPQFNTEGAVSGFVALISDISDRKKAEQEREQLLLREKAARTEAETANRLKDEFLATLSHELRTPLNAMSGWTQLLTTRKFDETTTARALETINRNTKSLKILIEDVLDVSRIITGKLHLKVIPVQLIKVVEAALDTVRPAAEAKEIRLESISDSSVGLVLGDANRLQQIVWNLVYNAIKFT
ncbi:PAS domain-containing sensor histidine kinase, partial [Phormidesmis priestleyi]